MKKGQVSLFIIIGLIVVLVVVFTLYAQEQQSTVTGQPFSITEARESVSSFVSHCLTTTSFQGLILLGESGGHIFYDAPVFYTHETLLSALYHNHQEYLVSVEAMETQLEEYVTAEVQKCVSDFQSFTEQGIAVSASEPVVTVNSETATVFTMDWPILLERGVDSAGLEEFRTTFPVRLPVLHRAAQHAIQLSKETEQAINNRESPYYFQDGSIHVIDNDEFPEYVAGVMQFEGVELHYEVFVKTQEIIWLIKDPIVSIKPYYFGFVAGLELDVP